VIRLPIATDVTVTARDPDPVPPTEGDILGLNRPIEHSRAIQCQITLAVVIITSEQENFDWAVFVVLCCADNDDMIVPLSWTAHYGPCSFHVAAPQIWNMLPPHLKNINVSCEQFKSGLKTWLFVQAYS